MIGVRKRGIEETERKTQRNDLSSTTSTDLATWIDLFPKKVKDGYREGQRGVERDREGQRGIERDRQRQRERKNVTEKNVFISCVCVCMRVCVVSKTMNPFRAQLYNIRKRYVNNTCKNFFDHNKQFFLNFSYFKEGMKKKQRTLFFFFLNS